MPRNVVMCWFFSSSSPKCWKSHKYPWGSGIRREPPPQWKQQLTILFTHKIQYTKKRCCEVACLCPLQLLTESDDMLMMLGYFNPRNGYEKKIPLFWPFLFGFFFNYIRPATTPFLRQPFRLGKALGKKEKKEVEKRNNTLQCKNVLMSFRKY